MNRCFVGLVALAACCGLVLNAVPAARASTIMKLHLNGDGANFGYSNGVFSALDDGLTSTPGSRNAAIEYVDAAQALALSLAPSESSFTLTGLTASSQSRTISGSLVVQSFDLGTLAIYGTDRSLLLEADLSVSAITGPLGPPSTQGLFLAFGEITGGTLAVGLDPDSLRVRMKLPTVTNGFSVTPLPQAPPPPTHYADLNAFSAMTLSIEILAEPIPEPAAVALLLIAGSFKALARRRPW
jgi:hypothetical protein